MDLLFFIGLHNATVVGLLAILVWSVTRIWKNQPAAHLMWLLVLVKLVMPPVVNIDVGKWGSVLVPATNKSAVDSPSIAPQPVGDVSRGSIPLSAEDARSDGERNLTQDVTQASVPGASSPSAVPPQPHMTVPAAWNAIQPLLMWTWIVGAGLVAILTGIRIVRFQRLIAGMLPASQGLKSVVDGLANRMGLRRCPDVRVTDSGTAPLVWSVGWRATVILPIRLLDALDEHQTAMVLAHELAHVRRCDHWVRVVELIVSTLYWWNPVVWWGRRQLHTVEEQCCDAWVAWMYPGRSHDYAECLFRAADLVMSHSTALVLGSPFLNTHTLKARVEVVLKNRSQRTASRLVVVCLGLFAAVVIPAGVYRAHGQAGRDIPAGEGRSDSRSPEKADGAPAPVVAEPNGEASSPSNGGTLADVAPAQNDANEQVFQGTWKFDACESVLWYTPLNEIRESWKWAIEGREMTWTRAGREPVRLHFTVDPSKEPKRIDFTFLDGPDKGKTCQGIYAFERMNLWICMTEPVADVPRPEKMAMSSTSKTALIILHSVPKNRIVPAGKADEGPPKPAPAANGQHTPPDLSLLQGIFNVEKWTSERWPAKPDELQKWQWTVQGEEVTWTRPGQEKVSLSFTIDASKPLPEIDLTFLDGPDKGEKCRGVYLASRHEVVICFQDPGENVHRPTYLGTKPGSHHTAISLVPARMPPVAEEIEALGGQWKFDIYYSDWWPARISNPPIRKGAWRWSFKGNEIAWTGMKIDDVRISFTLDPSKSPKQIDLTFLDGPYKGKALRGIYKFGFGNSCDICAADPDANADRPTFFGYATNSGHTWISLKRVADK